MVTPITTPLPGPELQPRNALEDGARAVFPVWSQLFAAVPVSPAISGLIFAAGVMLTFVGMDLWDGNLDDLRDGSVAWWRHVELRFALFNSLLLGVMLIVSRKEQLGIRHDLERLRPQLRGGDNVAELLVREASAVDPARLRIAGGVGAGLVASVVPALYLDPSRFLRLETWLLPSVLVDLAVGAVFGWTLGKVLYAGIRQDRAFARLSQRVAHIDLLDLSPLHPFARRGLRRTARWLLLAALTLPMFMDAGLAAWPALNLVAIFCLAGFSFVLPIRGIHQRIRAEKTAELRRVREEIERERRHVHDEIERRGVARGGPGGYLADLLAWEVRVAGAREWPIDITIVLRLVVFLLLPLGSWLGGAFVERFVDMALD